MEPHCIHQLLANPFWPAYFPFLEALKLGIRDFADFDPREAQGRMAKQGEY
jgi:hypothetical protein